MKNETMFRCSSRPGFALPVAIGMFLTATITFSGVLSYVTYSTRYVKGELARGRCLAAAQSAIEILKGKVYKGFQTYQARQGNGVHLTTGVVASHNFALWSDVKASSSSIQIGKEPVVVTNPSVVDDRKNGCRVYLYAYSSTAQIGELTIVATGVDSRGNNVTVAETFNFANSVRSPVFNHAYFVNNYGWMSGDSIIINGDMRANGNMSIAGSTVNGVASSAPNEEINAAGTIRISESPKVWSRSTYLGGGASNRARPASPPGNDPNKLWNGGFSAPSKDLTLSQSDVTNPKSEGHAYLSEAETSIPMPYISDLSDYRTYAQELNSSSDGSGASAKLEYYPYNPATGKIDTNSKRTINVSNYTVDDNTDTKWENEMVQSADVGPSGIQGAGDQGALVLVGTKDHPIKIDGPVIIASDVIIMGYITGQGTIYSGRNVHIVGDLTYRDPPTWKHPDDTPETTRLQNQGKDLVALMAKGCVVVGDYTDADWQSEIEPYINASGTSGQGTNIAKSYYCDENDTSIGYPDPKANVKFNGNYAAEISKTVSNSQVKKVYDKSYQVPITYTEQCDKNGKVKKTGTKTVGTPVVKDISYSGTTRDYAFEKIPTEKGELTYNSRSRTYERKVTEYAVIGDKSDGNYNVYKDSYAVVGYDNYHNAIKKKIVDYYKNNAVRYYDSVVSDSLIRQIASTGNNYVYGTKDANGKTVSAGVSRIDSVIYDNHGTFGHVGQYGRGFTINGSLICRDEGLVGHNMARGDKMVFNWDIRLKSDGAESVDNSKLVLSEDATPQTTMWQIVPSTTEWNPNFNPGAHH